LEQLLQDSQEKLTAANHRYVVISSYLHLLDRSCTSKVTKSPSSSHPRNHLPILPRHRPPHSFFNPILTPQQFRSPTHRRQRAPRSRQARFHARPRIPHLRRFLCVRRRRRLAHREAAPWRSRCARWTGVARVEQPAGAGGREWRGEEDELVFQSTNLVGGAGLWLDSG
jgi:hypothetical protein